MRCSLTISSASTECTPEVSLVRSTPLSNTSSSSSGGSMSTPMLRNFWRILAYMTSCTPLLRSSARICSMRRKSTIPPLSFSSWLTSMLPSDCSCWSSSSIMRSRVASTAASKSCGSASRTCASIWPCPEPGDMGAPWKVGSGRLGFDEESESDPSAAATFTAPRRTRRGANEAA